MFEDIILNNYEALEGLFKKHNINAPVTVETVTNAALAVPSFSEDMAKKLNFDGIDGTDSVEGAEGKKERRANLANTALGIASNLLNRRNKPAPEPEPEKKKVILGMNPILFFSIIFIIILVIVIAIVKSSK